MCFAKKAKKETAILKKPPSPVPAAQVPEIAESSKESSKPTKSTSNIINNKKSSTSSKKVARDGLKPPGKGAMNIVQPWVHRTLDVGVQGLIQEFRGLAKWTPEGMTTEAFNANKDKNRYQDVPCQDKGRIVLKHPGLPSDYIHANYLATAHKPTRFICAQGPLENTQHSFWAMVVQEKVECIIMLCNCIEQAKIKCHQYWPADDNIKRMTFGAFPNQITVTFQNARKLSSEEQTINVTTLKVEWADTSRTVQHFQWENWPDRGVPMTNLTAVELLSATRGNQNPILVHCSAGIGRTGTIVAIAYVMEKMQAGEDCMAMNELLKELRSQRPWSIQNEFQYLYLHRVLLTYFLERHKDLYESVLTGAYQAKYKTWGDEYKMLTEPKGA